MMSGYSSCRNAIVISLQVLEHPDHLQVVWDATCLLVYLSGQRQLVMVHENDWNSSVLASPKAGAYAHVHAHDVGAVCHHGVRMP